MSLRLSKYIAQCGVASRRGADALIKNGEVTVNDVVVYEAFTQIDPTSDRVAVNGTICTLEEEKVYVMLNKPRGYICSSNDQFAKKLAIDLIDLPYRLYSVGRLDKDSEGLILFTNDGDFAQIVGHPSFNIEKKYFVTIDEKFTAEDKRFIEAGIFDKGELLKPTAVIFKRVTNRGFTVLEFVLNEGKNREIRRICDAMGWKVRRLQRVAIGKLRLKQLEVGKFKSLTQKDMALIGVKFPLQVNKK